MAELLGFIAAIIKKGTPELLTFVKKGFDTYVGEA